MNKLNQEQKALKELQDAVNKVLEDTFKEEKLQEDSPLWSVLLELVPENAKAEDTPLIIACNYILLTYQGSKNIEGNKESLRLGNASYDGTNNNTLKINQAHNLLVALGFNNINFGVVNA